MMKNLLLIMSLMSMLFLTSCKVVATEDYDYQANQETTTTTVTTTTPVTPTVNKAEQTADILAQLTKEDGTGEISLNMTVDEIATVLDKYNIEYTKEGLSISVLDTATTYTTQSYMEYGTFYFNKTYSGLCVGNSRDDVLQIYGMPDSTEVYHYGQVECLVYVQKILNDGYQTPIILNVQIENDIVSLISVMVDIQYDKIYGSVPAN